MRSAKLLTLPRIGAPKLTDASWLSVCAVLLLILVTQYSSGDVERYGLYYSQVAYLGLTEAFLDYRVVLGASEPLYFLVTFSLAKLGVSYLLFKSALFVFFVSSVRAMTRSMSLDHPIVPVVLALNFYVLVVVTELERLCLALAFLSIAVALMRRGKKGLASLACVAATMSHFVIFILIYAAFAGIFARCILRLRAPRPNYSILSLLALAAVAGLLILPYQKISEVFATISFKLQFYQTENATTFPVEFALLFPFFYAACRGSVFYVGAYLALLPAIYLLGGDRLNMFLVLLTVYAGFAARNFGLPIWIVLIYCSAKGLGFWVNFLISGRGYDL